MTPGHYPLSHNPFDFIAWPEDTGVVLVLDSCIIQDLGLALFEWSSDITQVDCLYDNTPWEPVRDVSPWAVWLSGPDDPALRHFVEHEAANEAGYLLFTPLSYPQFSRWMRQRIQIERAPEAVELVRISHPALAREIIGDHLIRTGPEGAIQQMVLPDRTTGQWHHLALKTDTTPPDLDQTVSLSPGLFEAFSRFNVRRADLMIWDGLDEPTRKALGGPALPKAWPELCRLSAEAGKAGKNDIRQRTQYLRQCCSQEAMADQRP
ncbi:DUF4123 domain-containing protein [Marinobacter lacisalsi]|uniref:DUF4123 domain-containing protein n=1 Tax=Marinobacter lacisalsi TaxID=475979 RepID=A0ABV8QD81_9GAMM